jgi:hypothetical protein
MKGLYIAKIVGHRYTELHIDAAYCIKDERKYIPQRGACSCIAHMFLNI